MIENDLQYQVAKRQFMMLFDAIAATRAQAENVHPLLVQAQRQALESKLNEINLDIMEYEEEDLNYEDLRHQRFEEIRKLYEGQSFESEVKGIRKYLSILEAHYTRPYINEDGAISWVWPNKQMEIHYNDVVEHLAKFIEKYYPGSISTQDS